MDIRADALDGDLRERDGAGKPELGGGRGFVLRRGRSENARLTACEVRGRELRLGKRRRRSGSWPRRHPRD